MSIDVERSSERDRNMELAARLSERQAGMDGRSAQFVADAKSLLDDVNQSVRTETRASLDILLLDSSASKADQIIYALLIEYWELSERFSTSEQALSSSE